MPATPLEEVLDPPRRDGLPPAVLVDVLHPVDDLHLVVVERAEDVTGRQPSVDAVDLEGRIGGDPGPLVGEVARNVGATDEHLAAFGVVQIDAGKGAPHCLVDVLPWRAHRDAAGGLGHAEAAAEVDAVALEEAKRPWLEVPRGGEAPAQCTAGELLHVDIAGE